MELMITRQEVMELAFADSPSMNVSRISEAAVLTAQRKFIAPVLGGLYKRAVAGETPQLTDSYIKPALALYVKLLLLPTLANSIGMLGIVHHKGGTFVPADGDSLVALKKRVRADADTLLRRAVEYIEANSREFPEYNATQNPLNRVSISAGVVL